MGVSSTSQLNYSRKSGSKVMDEIEQILILFILQSERLEVQEKKIEEDFNAFTPTLTLNDWATTDHYVAALQDQPKADNKVENSVQCVHKEKRQRHTSSCSETSSSGSLKLKLRLQKKSEDVETWSVAENISNYTSSTINTPASCCQNIQPTIEKQRMKVDAEQLQVLEETFAASQYVVGKKRRALAERLGLTEKQVGNWFEYRRRRMRQTQSETIRNKKAVSARSGRPPKNTDASFTAKQEPFDVVSTTSARHPQNVDASFTVKPEFFDTFISSSPWQLKYGDAPSSVNRNSFDTISTYSSNPSTAWDLEDSQSPNHENEFNSFGSRMSLEISPSEQSVSSEDISSWPGNLEENEDFSYLHAAGEDYNLLSIMGLENMYPNVNTSSQSE